MLSGCYASAGGESSPCTEAPSCPAGFTEVAACTGLDCIEQTRCDIRVACVRGTTCEGEPLCADGIEVEECEGSCSEASACGTSVTCESASCSAAPACSGDEEEVARCAPSDADCRTITRCGVTTHCALADCVAESPCRYPDSEIEIDGCATPGGDSACDEQVDACGRLIGCHVQFGEDGLGGAPCIPRCEKHEERVLRCPQASTASFAKRARFPSCACRSARACSAGFVRAGPARRVLCEHRSAWRSRRRTRCAPGACPWTSSRSSRSRSDRCRSSRLRRCPSRA